MKRFILTVLLLCAAGCRTACDLSEITPEEMHGFLDNAVGKLGKSHLTEEDELIGTRETDADGWYMTEIHIGSGGNYIRIDYTDFTGKAEMSRTYSDRDEEESGET